MNTNRAVPLDGRVVYYRSDGTGRDTYIRNSNGGLLGKDHLHKIAQDKPAKQRRMSFGKTTYNKHPTSYQFGDSNRFPHYISDGSGRDFYVKSTEGGNSHPFRWRNQTDYRFKNSLRGHDPFPNRNPEKVDVFSQTQMEPTLTESAFRRTMSVYQSHLDRRLSEPKKSLKPPPIHSYFENKNPSSNKNS